MVELMQGQTKNTGEKLTKAYNLLTEINYTAHNFLLAKRDKLFIEAICSALPPRFNALKIDPIYIKDKLNDLKLVTQRIENSKDYELFTKQSYIMLCIVQFYINNQPQECWKNVLKITEDYPVNQISALIRIYFAQELNKNQVSWEVLVNYQNQKNIPTIFNYYRGLVDLQRLDPRGGFFMSKFLKKNPGQRFVKSAYLNLGYAFLLNKDTFYYRNALKLGRKFGSITNEKDNQSNHQLLNSTIPNVSILKCKLLIDGGFNLDVQKRIKKINPVSILNEEDKIALEYLSIASYYTTKKESESVRSLERFVLSFSQSKSIYLIKAFYDLGLLNEKQKLYDMANIGYQNVLDLKYIPGKSRYDFLSIAGLNRIVRLKFAEKKERK